MDNKLLKVKSFKTLYSALLMKFKSMIKKSDWNQNDKNADDYIKNRPFYEECSIDTYLDKQTIGEFHSWNDCYAVFDIDLNLNSKMEVGKYYTINWDGVEYISELRSEDGGRYLGFNAYYGEHKEYPFCIWLTDLTNGLINSVYSQTPESSHTVYICTKKYTIKKLDEKYLPELGVKSWNDLEDKPFCDETETIVYLEETEIYTRHDINYDNCYYTRANIQLNSHIEYGKTYIIKWDGIEYIVKPKQDEAGLYFGLNPYYNNNEDNLPFGIWFENKGMIYTEGKYLYNSIGRIFTFEDVASYHYFSIYELDYKIHKLDEKFIPDMDYITLLSPNGTIFSITVGDDGVLSASEITE